MSIVPRVRNPALDISARMHLVQVTEIQLVEDLDHKDFYYLLNNKSRTGAENLWCVDQCGLLPAFSVIILSGTPPCSPIDVLSLAAFVRQQQSWIIATRIVWSAKPKNITLWPFKRINAQQSTAEQSYESCVCSSLRLYQTPAEWLFQFTLPPAMEEWSQFLCILSSIWWCHYFFF